MSKIEREVGLYFKNDKANAPNVSVETAVLCQSGKTRDIVAKLITILAKTRVLNQNDRYEPILTGEDLEFILPDFKWDAGPDEDEDEDEY